MGYIQSLLAFFRKDAKEAKNQIDQENCPFCWGYQEFGSQKRTMGMDKQIDVKNHRDKHVKVGKFMVEHLDGFKNKKRIVERCPECGGKRIKYIENT